MPDQSKKFFSRFTPIDINIPLIIKYISDWHILLKKISPLSSFVFIALNAKKLLDPKVIVTALLFVPALIITPSFEILRLIFSVCILWIFIRKFDEPYDKFSAIVTAIVCLYSFIIFLGIFVPEFYLKMEGNTYRYKFILESHNALSVLVFISFLYLVNSLLYFDKKEQPVWIKVTIFISLILLTIVLLFIKSRLYIGLSWLFVAIVAFQNFKSSKLTAAIPLIYIAAFMGLAQFSQYFAPGASGENSSQVATNTNTPSSDKKVDTTAGGTSSAVRPSTSARTDSLEKKYEIIDNKRILSFSSTGRWSMTRAFFEMFREMGWKQFIYQNNTDEYLRRKSQLPNINVNASTLTESTYLVILLYTGYLGLATYLFIFGYYIAYFLRRKEYFSLLYFLLMMGVWVFEETMMFPFSLITHLFALATINRFERIRVLNRSQSNTLHPLATA